MAPSSPSAVLDELGRRAKVAARLLGLASTSEKDAALLHAADLLVERSADILTANGCDKTFSILFAGPQQP